MARTTKDYNVDTVVIEFKLRDDQGTKRRPEDILSTFRHAVNYFGGIREMASRLQGRGITVLDTECKLV